MNWMHRMAREFIAPTLILTLAGSMALAALALFESVAIGLVLFFYAFFNAVAPVGLFYAVFRLIVRRLPWPSSRWTWLAQTGLAFALLGAGLAAWSALSVLVYYASLSGVTRAAVAAEYQSEFAGYLPLACVAGLLAPVLSAAFDRRQSGRER